MARVYKSVCQEIDRLYIKILDLSDQQIKHKVELEKLITYGFSNIAKARFVMGSPFVSTLQQLPTENLNLEIKPLSTISRERCKNHDVFKLELRKPSSLVTEFKSSNENQEENNETESIIDWTNLNTATVVPDNKFQEIKDEYCEDADLANFNEYSDPIKLFGALVPFTLRIAQQFFKDSLFIVVKCATLQSHLNSTLIRHKYLSEIKSLVEQAAADRCLNLYSVSDFQKSGSTLFKGDNSCQEGAFEECDREDLYAEDIGFQIESVEELYGE